MTPEELTELCKLKKQMDEYEALLTTIRDSQELHVCLRSRSGYEIPLVRYEDGLNDDVIHFLKSILKNRHTALIKKIEKISVTNLGDMTNETDSK